MTEEAWEQLKKDLDSFDSYNLEESKAFINRLNNIQTMWINWRTKEVAE